MLTGMMTQAELERRREARRRLLSGRKLVTDAEAAQYVDERGLALLCPLPDLPLPSITEADSRQPWSGFDITDGAWRWKEMLPAAKLCAYQKLIRNRGTFISWRLYPSFYVLYGPEASYEDEYHAGRLERLAYIVLQTVEDEGMLSSRELWQKVRFHFGGNRARFEAVLAALQRTFCLTVAGGSLEGWSLHYWDLTERQVPHGLLDNLPSIGAAREALLLQAIDNLVVASISDLRAILRWPAAEVQAYLQQLVEAGRLTRVRVEDERALYWALAGGVPADAATPRARE